MIRFNNYPPTQPEDIELTEEAKTTMGYRARMPNDFLGRSRDVFFRAYGEAVGHTIVASMEEPDFMGAYRLHSNVAAGVKEASSPEAHRAYASGFNHTVIREIGEAIGVAR